MDSRSIWRAGFGAAMLLLALAGARGTDDRGQVLVGERIGDSAPAEALEPARHPFTFDNLGSPFGIGAVISGEYAIWDNDLILHDCVVTIHQQAHCVNPDGRDVAAICLKITEWNDQCEWVWSSRDAEEFPVEHLLLPDEEYVIGPFSYEIPIESPEWLRGKRLTLQVFDMTYGRGSHFAHSSGQLFVPQPSGIMILGKEGDGGG